MFLLKVTANKVPPSRRRASKTPRTPSNLNAHNLKVFAASRTHAQYVALGELQPNPSDRIRRANPTANCSPPAKTRNPTACRQPSVNMFIFYEHVIYSFHANNLDIFVFLWGGFLHQNKFFWCLINGFDQWKSTIRFINNTFITCSPIFREQIPHKCFLFRFFQTHS